MLKAFTGTALLFEQSPWDCLTCMLCCGLAIAWFEAAERSERLPCDDEAEPEVFEGIPPDIRLIYLASPAVEAA